MEKPTPILKTLYLRANDYEKRHYRKAAIERFDLSDKHFFKWVKTSKDMEAVALWQFCFKREIVEKWVVSNFKFHEQKIPVYQEPDLFNQNF